MDHLVIDETTKVAALLDAYPELEGVLIGIAPPFKKLRNPVLRRSVAKVASLRQAAAVTRIRKIPGSDRVDLSSGALPSRSRKLTTPPITRDSLENADEAD